MKQNRIGVFGSLYARRVLKRRAAAVYMGLLLFGLAGAAAPSAVFAETMPKEEPPGITGPPVGNNPGAGKSSIPGKEAADPVARMSDIHDIKGVVPAPPDYRRLLVVAAASAAALTALFFIVRRLRKGRRDAPDNAAAPALPPETAALEALDRLSDMDRIDGKDFYFRLSAVLRGYIEGRFDVKALEMTTEELLPRIRHLRLPGGLEAELKRFFRNTEPIRFAGYPAVGEQMKTDLLFARRFVKQTAPLPEAAEASDRPETPVAGFR
jgi:hypothetical protein